MPTEKYVEPLHFSLKSSKEYDEKWLQGKISENPDILGLTSGLSTVSVERKQFNGGRLDLLLEDENSETRYTVEVQLGATDEAHIIRTIEYWDNERSRNPHMEHVAVIVAEDVTSRFLNVIQLFNKSIPLVAIQLKAYRVEGMVMLVGVKVLDLRGNVGEDVKTSSLPADRAFWVKKAGEKSMKMVDVFLKMIRAAAPESNIELNYTKPYIGIAVGGIVDNFVALRPNRRGYIHVDFNRIPRDDNDEFLQNVEESEWFNTYSRWGGYRMIFRAKDLTDDNEMIQGLLNKSISSSRI